MLHFTILYVAETASTTLYSGFLQDFGIWLQRLTQIQDTVNVHKRLFHSFECMQSAIAPDPHPNLNLSRILRI